MKNHFEKLIQKAGMHVALTETERTKMRLLLREYAGMKPVRAGGPVREPDAQARLSAQAGTAFIGVWLAYLRRPASITVTATLVLALSSGGIAYAAEGALPGDTLYPVKVSVVEPVRIALAASPEVKASLQMAFAENRVDEAATLASRGKLGTTTEAALAANFNKNASGAAATVARAREQNQTAADVLATNFSARLEAYEDVLAAVDKRSRGSENTEHLQTVIHAQIALITSAEADETPRVMSSSLEASVPDRKAVKKNRYRDVQRLQDAADKAVHVSATIVGTASSTLDASSSASALEELKHASKLAERGRKLLERQDEEGASKAFQDSLSATARLDVLTRASAKLDIQAFATTTASTSDSDMEIDESPSTDWPDSRKQEGEDIQFGL